MATASPSAVLAVPERPLPERSEAKSADGSDGQFAGLMAQFVQTQPPQRPPEPKAPEPPRGDKDTQIQTREDASKATPAGGTAQAASSPRAEDGDVRKGAQVAKEDRATPKADPTPPPAQTPVLPAKAPTPPVMTLALPQAPPVATAIKATGLPALTPTSTEPQAQAALKLTEDEAKALALQVASQAAQAAGTPPAPKMSPTALALQLAQQAEQGQAKTQGKVQTDAPQPSQGAAVQALLAESNAKAKELVKALALAHGEEAQKGDGAHPPEKIAKVIELPVANHQAAPATTKAAPVTAPQAVEHESSLNTAKAATASPVETNPLISNLETQLTPNAQAPMLQAPDGSALAALGTLGKTAATAVPTPVAQAPATPATPPSAPVVQVEGGVRWMLKTGAQEAQLQLHPESLGQVTIHLKVEGGEVHARLWVTEPASVQAVQEGRPHLEQSLKEQGLQLGSFDLQQGHRPFQEAPSTPTFREPAASETVAARQEAPVTIQPSILNPHRVELYA